MENTEREPWERYYGRRAAEYERIYEKPERQEDLTWLAGWLARQLDGEHVLDVACGTGYWPRRIVRDHGVRFASYLGVDVRPEVLEIARAGLPETAEFVVGDAYALPEMDEGPTRVCAGFFWSHVPRDRIERFVRPIAERLRGRGRLVLFDNLYVEGSSTPISRRDADGNSYQQRGLDSGEEWEVLKNFPDPEGLEITLGSFSGEGSVEIEASTYFWTVTVDFRGM